VRKAATREWVLGVESSKAAELDWRKEEPSGEEGRREFIEKMMGRKEGRAGGWA